MKRKKREQHESVRARKRKIEKAEKVRLREAPRKLGKKSKYTKDDFRYGYD